MPDMTVDTLNIKISASATDASHALTNLANSLKKVRSALGQTGKDGTDVSTKMARSLADLRSAISKIDNGSIKRLERLSDALNNYASAMGKLKGLGVGSGVAKQIKDVSKTITTKSDMATASGGSAKVGRRKDFLAASDENDVSDNDDVIDAKWKPVKEKIGMLSKFLNSISRIALYRAIRSAMKAVAQAFEEGLKNAYYFSKQTEGFHKLAESMDKVKSLSVQMTNQLGAVFAGLKQFVQPIVEWLIEKIRMVAEWLTEFFAALNGEDTYMVAKYVQTAWDGATDSLKTYKHQLLGLDELNVLKTKDDEEDYTKYYEEKDVSPNMKKLGDEWRGVVRVVSDALKELSDILVPALGIIGAILLFTGHPVLGIGCIIGGISLWGSKAKDDPDYNEGKVEGELEGIMNTIKENLLLVSLGLGVIGTILLFTGHIGLGLGFIIGGISLWAGKMHEEPGKFEGVKSKLRKAMKNIRENLLLVALGLGVLGTVLLFTGHIPLGLGLILGGISLWAGKKKDSGEPAWDSISKKLEETFKWIKDNLIFLDLGLIALGAVFLFTGNFALGLGMLTAAGMITEYEVSEFGWDGVLEQLQKAFANIQSWWDETVVKKVNDAVSWAKEKMAELEEFLHIDLNGDGIKGFKRATEPITVGTQQIPGIEAYFDEGGASSSNSSSNSNIWSRTLKDLKDWMDVAGFGYDYKNNTTYSLSEWWDWITSFFGKKAHGGIVNQGTLFYAGEAGAELVGKMGNNTAVANTGQMTDAIYKAAYMGMSQALKENGGNGFGGFEPATTDDLFIAMRKKASKFNKTTGMSAFS